MRFFESVGVSGGAVVCYELVGRSKFCFVGEWPVLPIAAVMGGSMSVSMSMFDHLNPYFCSLVNCNTYKVKLLIGQAKSTDPWRPLQEVL